MIRANPMRYSGGEGGGSSLLSETLVSLTTTQRFVVVLATFRKVHHLQTQVI